MADPFVIRRRGIAVRARAHERIEILRCRGRDGPALDALGGALDGLPSDVPGRASGAAPRVAWLAPGEWMVVGMPGDGLAGRGVTYPAHVVDVSGGRVGFDVSGAASRDLLAKGTSLDLHPRVFPEGRCARTLFAYITVLIDRPSDDDAFRMYADASYAAYLRTWFVDATEEFEAN